MANETNEERPLLVSKNAGICLPRDLVKVIDEVRGDVSRSRFVLRAVEHVLDEKKIEHSEVV